MQCRSSSSPRLSGALALLLASAGCFADFAEDDALVDLHLVQPGGLGFELRATGRSKDELYVTLNGYLTNLGTEPCHVAIFLHTTEAVREDIPALTGPPAPAVADAQLMFETVLAPPNEGREFTRDLDYLSLFPEKLARDGELRRWLTIATCEAPDLQIELELNLSVQFLVRRRGERSAAIDRIWP